MKHLTYHDASEREAYPPTPEDAAIDRMRAARHGDALLCAMMSYHMTAANESAARDAATFRTLQRTNRASWARDHCGRPLPLSAII